VSQEEERVSNEPRTAREEEVHQEREEDKLSHAGGALRNLTDSMVRSMCGEQVYASGLVYYMEGRISERSFSNNTISAKMNARSKKKGPFSGGGPEFFEPSLTFGWAKGRRISVFGKCGCSWSQDGILCPHSAALMIAWVRKPRAFDEAELPQQLQQKHESGGETPAASLLFDKTKKHVMRSLEELVDCIQNGSSRTDDLEVLEKMYSKIRLWTNQVREVRDNGAPVPFPAIHNTNPQSGAGNALIRQFSETINSVSFAVICAIENKYPKVNAMDLYNSTTTSTFAKVLESFVESSSYHSKSTEDSFDDGTEKQEDGKSREILLSPAATVPRAARSWDSLLDELATTTTSGR
jgi:hypothetical protein